MAVIIRGTEGYEWLSNFKIADPNVPEIDHYGFKTASARLLADLINFRTDLINKGIDLNNTNTKIWVTGHSRGAAVANLVAHELNQSYSSWASENNIYAYTFATPNVSTKSYLFREPNIINFGNKVDFVSQVPLTDGWGYSKYGRTKYFDVLSSDDYFNNTFSRISQGKTYDAYGLNVGTLIKYVLKVAPTVYDYYMTQHVSHIVYAHFSSTTNDVFNSLARLKCCNNLAFLDYWFDGTSGYGDIARFLVNNSGYGIKNNDLFQDYITEAHSIESYISYVESYNANDDYSCDFGDGLTENTPSYFCTLENNVQGDLVINSDNVSISGGSGTTRKTIYGDVFVQGGTAALNNLSILGNVILNGSNAQLSNCTVGGNSCINGAGASINNVTASGSVEISGSVKDGTVTFTNFQDSDGTLSINGGGSNSVKFIDSQVGQMIVQKDYSLAPETVHIFASGETTINNSVVSGSAILENSNIGAQNSGIASVELPDTDEPNPTVVLRGYLPSVTADTGTTVQLDTGSTVNQFNVSSNASGLDVTGTGSIQSAAVSAQVADSVQIEVPTAITHLIYDFAGGLNLAAGTGTDAPTTNSITLLLDNTLSPNNGKVTAYYLQDDLGNKNYSDIIAANQTVPLTNGKYIVSGLKSGTQYDFIAVAEKDGYNNAYSSFLSVKTGYAVTGVSLDKTSATLIAGQSMNLNAAVSPADALNNNVTWSSSNTSVATVDNSGKVTAVGKGTAAIAVKTEDGGYTASCMFSVTGMDAQVISLIGSDRYDTAVKLSQSQFSTADTILIVNGGALADGLGATPLAAYKQAPILLTAASALPLTTKNEIKRLKAKNAIIIGGTGVVNQSIENELKTLGVTSVIRIGGTDRYDTSLEIAKYIDKNCYDVSNIVVSNGLGEADALSIASVAGRDNMPIVLVKRDEIPSMTYSWLVSKNLDNAYIIGGTGVVSDSVLNKINDITAQDIKNNRLGGKDRYETNAIVIDRFYGNILSKAYIAKGILLVDALASGPVAAINGAPVVLSGNDLSLEQKSVLGKRTANTIIRTGGGISDKAVNSLKSCFQ